MFTLLKSNYKANKTRIHRISKEGGWILGGQVASVLGALALVRVLTEYLNPDQYGQLTLGLTVAGLVHQVVMGGLTAGISRYYSIAAERQDLGGYLHATCYLLASATAATLIVGFILIISLHWLGYSNSIGLAVAALLLAVLNGYNSILSGIQNAARQRSIVAFHGGLDAFLKIGLAIGVMVWLGTSSNAVMIGYACSSALITISQIIFLQRTIGQSSTAIVNPQHWITKIWAYSLPFTIFGAFTWVHQISDRWALQVFGSTSDAGQYAVLFQLGFTPIALITGMVMSFLGPILYQQSVDATDHGRNADVHHIAWRITHLSLIVTLVSFATTYTLHEWIFGLLVASAYLGSSHLLPWVVMAGGIFAAGQMLALKLFSEMKTSAMTAAKIVTAIIGTLLNVGGAALAGLEGVVWAMVIFSIMYFIWMAVLASRIENIET